MSTMGTFDAFTSARLGIYAAQHGLRVTGNNISNINTEGYTRQRLDQVSFKAGAYDRYRSQLDNHVGSGALVMNINQVRDPYLDVRYRDTAADVGYNDTMLAGLKEIADILDEVGVGEDTNANKKGDGRLHAQIQALATALRNFSKEPTKANNDLVRTEASILCDTLHLYADKLERLRQDTIKDFNDRVTEINECLTNIRDLNDEIRDNEIFGDNALELRDERNRQIDALSKLIHIKVVYSEENVGSGRTVEKLSIYLDNDNPDPAIRTDESLLIDGIFGTQLSSPAKLPIQNPLYDPDAAATADQQPEAFRYVTNEQLTNAAGEFAFLDADGNIQYFAKDDPAADGLTPVMKGTNDIAEADTYDNDNYTIQIGKLLDDKGREWEGRTTEWTPVTEAQQAQKAIYKVALGAITGWAAGDKFDVAGKTYTIADPNATPPVKGDITLDDMQDAKKLAEFVAPKLNAVSTGYTITTDGNGNLVYTAKKSGAIGQSGPSAAPNAPTFTPNGGNGVINIGALTEEQPGKESLPTIDTPEGTTDNADGTQTIVAYRKKDGQWFKVTTQVEKTYEVTLDDNDLHGALQAVRELLTEKGEFSTPDDVAIDEDAANKHWGIPYYQLSLDLLAREFAKQYNKLNQGPAVDQNGNPVSGEVTQKLPMYIVENDGTVKQLDEAQGLPAVYVNTTLKVKNGYLVDANGKYTGTHGTGCDINGNIPADGTTDQILDGLVASGALTADQRAAIDALPDADKAARTQEELTKCLAAHGTPPDKEVEITDNIPTELGGPLFSIRGDLDETEGITASNISVSHSWSTGDVQLVPKFEILWGGDIEHSTQNTNADHMVTMTEQILIFNPKDLVPDAVSNKLFEGDFGDMFNNMSTILGDEQRSFNVALNTHYTQLVEIDTNRDGVSGVDLNDEAMNMVQFQKAMNAAMRLMTAIDEALDRLINNTGIAGR